MSGKAFDLKEDAFPRISSSAYASVEKSLGTQLKALYKRVETPTTSPWLANCASVYFVVSEPVSGNAEATRASLKGALGAAHDKVATPGNPISIFAVPITGAPGKFYKIEVHECSSKAELEMAKCYLSYGDLGMIMSLMARVHGFVYGTKGLKTHYGQPDDTRISGYVLSISPDEILIFYGLSVDAWKRGFRTQDEVFAWLKKSKFYNARQLVAANTESAKKSDPSLREMYHSFIMSATAEKQTGRVPNLDAERERALLDFGRKKEYDELVHKNRLDRVRREKYNGNKVMDWTKLRGIVIREIMNKVRDRIGEKGLLDFSEDDLKIITMKVAEETPAKPYVKKA